MAKSPLAQGDHSVNSPALCKSLKNTIRLSGWAIACLLPSARTYRSPEARRVQTVNVRRSSAPWIH